MRDEHSELIQRIRQRDLAAWSSLYELHYDDVYRYAFARVAAREEAEDVTSQVFVEALKNLNHLSDKPARNGVTPLLAWLLGIARQVIEVRTRQTKRAAMAMPVSLVDAGDVEPLVDRLDLLQALQRLTREQQDVIILRYFLAKTTSEIASLMGRKENAIFALQFRAVRTLKRLLAGDEEPVAKKPGARS